MNASACLPPERLRVVLVTGLSGAGKSSVLRMLEDLGYEAVDNPPLPMLEEMVSRSERRLAIGVDARTRGFDAGRVLQAMHRLRHNPSLRPELVYVRADETTLLRRYTESRRRHPLAQNGPVHEGIAQEELLTAPLQEHADLLIDTSELTLPQLRQKVERHLGAAGDTAENRLVVSLISFAYPLGLPREADLVFDARFLRNPHYEPILRPRTGLDPDVGAYIAADPDYAEFLGKLMDLVDLVLPRFVQEGKKYVTITIGCTGGRHRSVYLIEKLADFLESRIAAAAEAPGGDRFAWHLHVMHRELAREGLDAGLPTVRPVQRVAAASMEHSDEATNASPVQAQEA